MFAAKPVELGFTFSGGSSHVMVVVGDFVSAETGATKLVIADPGAKGLFVVDPGDLAAALEGAVDMGVVEYGASRMTFPIESLAAVTTSVAEIAGAAGLCDAGSVVEVSFPMELWLFHLSGRRDQTQFPDDARSTGRFHHLVVFGGTSGYARSVVTNGGVRVIEVGDGLLGRSVAEALAAVNELGVAEHEEIRLLSVPELALVAVWLPARRIVHLALGPSDWCATWAKTNSRPPAADRDHLRIRFASNLPRSFLPSPPSSGVMTRRSVLGWIAGLSTSSRSSTRASRTSLHEISARRGRRHDLRRRATRRAVWPRAEDQYVYVSTFG